MKFINSVLCLWIIFALLDPDPSRESGRGYGSRDPIESGFNSDRDPQHCFFRSRASNHEESGQGSGSDDLNAINCQID